MSLINCKECGKEISKTAKSCPHCGAKNKRSNPIAVILLSVIILLIFFYIVGKSSRSTISPTQKLATASTSVPTVQTLPGSQWSYSQEEDEMSKGTVYFAKVSSINTVNFDFPYAGEQHATLTLRYSSRHGKNVLFQIEKGQFLCPSYEECAVLVRFDDEQAVTYSGIGPSDNSTVTIFIQNYSRFLQKLLKAKRVRIAANIYQQGAPVFNFDVSGFDQNSYPCSNQPRKKP